MLDVKRKRALELEVDDLSLWEAWRQVRSSTVNSKIYIFLFSVSWYSFSPAIRFPSVSSTDITSFSCILYNSS